MVMRNLMWNNPFWTQTRHGHKKIQIWDTWGFLIKKRKLRELIKRQIKKVQEVEFIVK